MDSSKARKILPLGNSAVPTSATTFFQKFTSNTRLQALVLALCSVLLYAQTLRFDYVLDDGELIVRNPAITQGFAGIPALCTNASSFTGTAQTAQENGQPPQTHDGKHRTAYRPLSLISFAVEYQCAGNNAVVRHGVNTLVYAACVLVVFGVAVQLGASIHALLPFFVGLLFAVHPLHTEVVCNIKSRDELFAFFFSVGALFLVLRGISSKNFTMLVLACGSFFLGLLSKEHAITMLPIFSLAAWLLARQENHTELRSVWTTALGMCGVAVMWLALSLHLASWEIADANFADIMNNPYANAAPYQLLPTKFLVLAEYVLKLTFPRTMSFDYGFRVIEPTDWGWKPALALVFLLALLAHGVWYIRSKEPSAAVSALGLLWMAATMSIASNIFLYSGAAMADRFMFLPSAAWCLALVVGCIWFLERFREMMQKSPRAGSKRESGFGANLPETAWERAFLVILCCIALAWTLRTRQRIPDWNTPYTLSKAAVRDTPRSIKAHAAFSLEASLAFNQAKDSAERSLHAHDMYQSASALVSLAPEYARGAYSLALGFERFFPEKDTPNADSARQYYERALRLNASKPSNTAAHENTLIAHDYTMLQGNLSLRAAMRLAATGNNPEARELYNRAFAFYQATLQSGINAALSNANMGAVLAQQGRYQAALPYFKQACSLNPADTAFARRFALCSAQEAIERGNTALAENRLDTALVAYKEALSFGAIQDIAWLNIALVRSRQHNFQEAIQAAQQALVLNPANALGRQMLAQFQQRVAQK